MRKYITTLLLLQMLATPCLAKTGTYQNCIYQTADEVDAVVNASAAKPLSSVEYQYHYILISLPSSRQSIFMFNIIISDVTRINAMAGPPAWMAPVKIPPQSDAALFLGRYPRVDWGTWAIETEIRPGASLSGYAVTSDDLPGIIDYYLEGFTPLPECPGGMAVDFIPGYDDLTPYGPGVVGRTIGPVQPPATFIPLVFLDYISSLKQEAFKLGWIKNKGIEESLDAKLESAKAALQRGQPKTASNALNALLNEVEAQQGKGLTSEAYGLLKYNVLYLMERL
jgi:hypothetical protein